MVSGKDPLLLKLLSCLHYYRKLIAEFCWKLQIRINQYSLRSQIIAYYNSVLKLLDQFPNVRYLCTPNAVLQISVRETDRCLVVFEFQSTNVCRFT